MQIRLDVARTTQGIGLLAVRFVEAASPSHVRQLVTALVRAELATAPRTLPKTSVELFALPFRAPREAEKASAVFEELGEKYGVEAVVGVHVDASIDSSKKRGKQAKSKLAHWRNGPPPAVRRCSFPVEGYPAILRELDGENFGITLKLEGPPRAGEESLLRAFHEFWLAPYFDREVISSESFFDGRSDLRGAEEEAEDKYFPFRHEGVEWDAEHRSAVLWVDRFRAPASPAEMAHHLLFVLAKLDEIAPIRHARFRGADIDWKYREPTGDDEKPFVLAGNPAHQAFVEGGAAAAKRWIAKDKAWSKHEKAAMAMELVYGLDPDRPKDAKVALELCDAAVALSPTLVGARESRLLTLFSLSRVDEALKAVVKSNSIELALAAVDLAVDRAPKRLLDFVKRVDSDLEGRSPEALADLVGRVGKVSLEALRVLLRPLPASAGLVPYLCNASFKVMKVEGSEDPRHATEASLAILERAIELPEPKDGFAREAYLWAWSHVILHAVERGHLARATALAEKALHFAKKSPAIYHSAACAYAASRRNVEALAMVRGALAARYDDVKALRADDRLEALHSLPAFQSLFAKTAKKSSAEKSSAKKSSAKKSSAKKSSAKKKISRRKT